MTVFAEITVPSDHLPLGTSLAGLPEVTFRFESVVPVGESHIPFIWVDGHDLEAIRSTLKSDEAVDSIAVLENLDDEALLKVEWEQASFPLSEPLHEADGAIIDGSGHADTFRFTVRFPDAERLSAFYQASRNAGCPMTLERLHDSSHFPEFDPGADLTDIQRETLKTSYEMGYFSVPREANLLEVANRLGVSDTATSQRIRRGLTAVLGSMFDWSED